MRGLPARRVMESVPIKRIGLPIRRIIESSPVRRLSADDPRVSAFLPEPKNSNPSESELPIRVKSSERPEYEPDRVHKRVEADTGVFYNQERDQKENEAVRDITDDL